MGTSQEVKSNNIAVVIHTCDKYNYILDEFFTAFEKYFPYQYFDVILSTEKCAYNKPYVTNIVTGEGSWSDRFIKVLNHIPHQYFIFFQEDFIIQQVNNHYLGLAISLQQQLSAKIIKFGTNYDFALYEYGKIEDLPVYLQRDGEYIMSHQPVSMFDKQFFLQTLSEQHDCWTHELKVSKEIESGKYGQVPVYCVGHAYIPNTSDIITIHHAIRKGQYVGPPSK